MNQPQEFRMTYTGLLPQKDGKKIVRVIFERGKDYAEGIVPSGLIERSSGFPKKNCSSLAVIWYKTGMISLPKQRKSIRCGIG